MVFSIHSQLCYHSMAQGWRGEREEGIRKEIDSNVVKKAQYWYHIDILVF